MKKLFFNLLIIGVIAFTSIVLYEKWKQPNFTETVSTQELEGVVYTSEMALAEARKVGKLFGYENEWAYTYKLNDSPIFVKKTEEDNWFSDSAKSVGKFFLGKEYSIELANYFMLGYDLANLKKDDVRYINDSKTLVIKLPKLELSYTPDYAETEFESSVGLFRFDFSDTEKHQMYTDSIELGIEKFKTEETVEIEKGHTFTQEAIETLLFAAPEFSEHVKKIQFVQQTDEMTTSIEEYKKKTTKSN